VTALRFTPADAPRLPALLAAAPDGAVVTLAPGHYPLDATCSLAKSLTLEGEPGQTVLDGQGKLGILDALGSSVRYVFRGLTFTRGSGIWGAAVCSPNDNIVHFDRCTFLENQSTQNGSAVMLRQGTTTFERCVFERNVSKMSGAIDVGRGNLTTLDRCVFTGNVADVGAGVFLNDTAALIVKSCTFVGNKATRLRGGGALFVFGATSAGPTAHISNTVFDGDEPVNSDPSKKYEIFVANSVVPRGLFSQPFFRDIGHNTVGAPKLVQVGQSLWAIAPGSPGAGTADVGRITKDAVDLLGHPLVHDAKADPGALAQPTAGAGGSGS
jgi:Right handed beta helix region